MRSTTTVMAGVALAFFACSPSGFNTPTLLNKVRFLAIQAEPPQPAAPDPLLGTPGGSTTLRALVYQPPPTAGADAGPSLTWSWCPLPMSSTDPSQCPIGQPDADQLFAGIPGVPPLDLGTGETATFVNPFPAAMLADLCNGNLNGIPELAAAAANMGTLAANGGLTFNCTIAGFPITVVARILAGDLRAVFTVYLPINDAIAANVNPVVGDIYVTPDNSGPLDPNLRLDQTGTQQVLRNSKVPLVLDMPLSDSEFLPDPNQILPNTDPNNPNFPNSVLGPNDTTRERLYVNWYAEGGDFSEKDGVGGDTTTGYLGGDPNDPVSPFTTSRQNFWNTPKIEDYSASRASVILVIRDSRGGVTWTSGVATLVGTPPDAGTSDAPATDSGELTSAPEAGVPDSPEADAGELAPDAGVSDADQGNSADALLEIAP
jgi:hypothetical protein